MKKIFIFCLIVLFFSCKTIENNTTTTIKTGWSDADTYIVKVTAANEKIAIDLAKRKILKNITFVRIRNDSRYTDIVKIKGEFERPLEKGKVINRKNISSGIEIIYRIREKNLKKKFERK